MPITYLSGVTNPTISKLQINSLFLNWVTFYRVKDYIDFSSQLQDYTFTVLEHVKFIDSDISPANLISFLQKTPKVKTLMLSDCNYLANVIEIPHDLDLSCLEEIHCRNTTISTANLFILL